MPKNKMDSHAKSIAVLLLLTVLFCSFLGLEPDVVNYGTSALPLSVNGYFSQRMNLDELICSEEISASSQKLLLRQGEAKKRSIRTMNPDVVFYEELSVGFFVPVLLFCFLFDTGGTIHQYIIRYIHNMDGQKSFAS